MTSLFSLLDLHRDFNMGLRCSFYIPSPYTHESIRWNSFQEIDYLLRSFFTSVDIMRPSASPARRFVATPITLPMSEG